MYQIKYWDLAIIVSKRNNQSFRTSADFQTKQKKLFCWFKEQNNVFAFFTVRRNRRGQHADGFQVLLEKDMLSDTVIDLELLCKTFMTWYYVNQTYR